MTGSGSRTKPAPAAMEGGAPGCAFGFQLEWFRK